MPSLPPYSEESLQYYLWGLRKGFLTPDIQIEDIEVPEEFEVIDWRNAGYPPMLPAIMPVARA
jgi:hypothetical protein